MLFRETNPFKENIHYLRDAKDFIKSHVVHVACTESTGGPGGVGDVSDIQPDIQGEILNPQDSTRNPPKTRSDGTTTKNNDDLSGAANSNKKERQGRGPTSSAPDPPR